MSNDEKQNRNESFDSSLILNDGDSPIITKKEGKNGQEIELNEFPLSVTDSDLSNKTSTSSMLGANVTTSRKLWFAYFIMVIQSLNFGLGLAAGNNTRNVIIEYFNLTDDQFTWVTSILPLGGILGGVFGGKIVDFFGPKKASIVNDLGYMVSVSLLAGAQNYAMLLVGRFLLGVGLGITCACVPQYIAEITPIQWRGVLGVGHQQAVTLGILVASILGMEEVFGTLELWRLVWGAPLVPTLIHFCLIWFAPESPFFLYKRGKYEEGEAVLRSLRNDVEEKIQAEVKMMKDEIDTAASNAADDLPMLQALKLIFTNKSLFVPFIMAIYQQAAQQFSGINAIIFYSTSIFATANTGMTAEATTVLTMGVNCLAGFFGFWVIAKAGRKGSLLLGFGGMALFHILFAITTLYPNGGLGLAQAGIAFILLYICCFAIGPGPVPWLITSDLIPNKVRSVSLGLAVATNWLCTFLIGQIFPPMNNAIGGYSFIIFGGACLISFLIFLFFLIETDGMTRKQIDSWFENGHVLAPNYFSRKKKTSKSLENA
eukprot:Pgem_evm1s19507